VSWEVVQLPRRLFGNPLVMVQGISSLSEALEHVAVLQPDLLSLMKETSSCDHHYQCQTFICSYLRSKFLMMAEVGADKVMSLTDVGEEAMGQSGVSRG
jgi:hypothetical protein